MRVLAVGPDPDAARRLVCIPADWDDTAASALAALAPGDGLATLPLAAGDWIARAGTDLADRLHGLLLHRRGAPTAALWRGTADADARFVLNLAAFHDSGLEAATFDEAVETALLALAALAPAARRLTILITDLAGFIAARGVDYASDEGRMLARSAAMRLGAGLCAAAERHAGLHGRDLRIGASGVADTVDALLGAEASGIAPAFSLVDTHGRLTRAAAAFLAARGLSDAAALGATLAGASLIHVADANDHLAMRAALADLVDLPADPTAPAHFDIAAPPAAPGRRELPVRHAGYRQKATLAGHRIYLRTEEYPDGSLGELSIVLPKDGAAMRGLMEAFATSVSIGLQHGVPLAEFVDAFTQTRFGPAGSVEGDPAVPAATSVPDYVFRHLAVNYLGRHDLPPAEPDEADVVAAAPSLPLDLPADPRVRRRNLRLVG